MVTLDVPKLKQNEEIFIIIRIHDALAQPLHLLMLNHGSGYFTPNSLGVLECLMAAAICILLISFILPSHSRSIRAPA